MKKSFIMTVAVSMALSAVATETGYISGTSFEDISLGEKSSVELVKNANDLGVVNNVCYWSTDAWKTKNSADYEGFFVVTNIPDNASYQGSRPEYWATSTKKNALVIDTDKPLYRRINPVISMDNSTERTLDTKGVFFDSVVQFTATDVPLEPGNSDKLLVWLYTSPEDVATNPGLFDETTPKTTLVVTAGYYKENDNTLHTTNYCVAADNVSIKPDEWHRLTIKAFISNDGKHALFNVYVDGKKVKTEDEMSDFISLKDNLTSIPDIIGVAFDGKGMVDDIAFTTTAPSFAQEEEPPVATYTLNVEGANFSYQVFADEGWGTKINDLTAIRAEYKTLWLGITPVEGWELASIKFGDTDVELPEYDEDDQVYYLDELRISTDAIANGAEYTLTITMKEKDAGGTDDSVIPTVGGIEIVVDATTGKITNITTADNGKTVVGELDTTKFADYYTVSVKDGVLNIALNPEVATPEINETATDEGDAIVVTDNAVELGVTNAIPGLWYGAQAYDDVACAEANKIGEEATGWVQATTTTVSVTAEKPTKKEGELTVVVDKAFFRVVVDDQDHTPPLAEQE